MLTTNDIYGYRGDANQSLGTGYYWNRECDKDGVPLQSGIGTINLVGGSGGTGYVAGDTLYVSGGSGRTGTITVLSVDGSGVILTYSISDTGTGYTTGVKATTGGTGTGGSFNIDEIQTSAVWVLMPGVLSGGLDFDKASAPVYDCGGLTFATREGIKKMQYELKLGQDDYLIREFLRTGAGKRFFQMIRLSGKSHIDPVTGKSKAIITFCPITQYSLKHKENAPSDRDNDVTIFVNNNSAVVAVANAALPSDLDDKGNLDPTSYAALVFSAPVNKGYDERICLMTS